MKTTKSKKNSSPLLITNGIGEPTHDEIALGAYFVWEQEGRPQSDDLRNWIQAESQLHQARKHDAVQPRGR